MKLFLLLLLLFPVFCHAQTSDAAVERITSTVEKTEKRFERSRRSFVLKRQLKNRRTVNEKWSYLASKGNVEAFEVKYRAGQTEYIESYYLENGQLIHAGESEKSYAGNKPDAEIISSWSGVYFFANRRLLDHRTNGHGKSEEDNWDPQKETLQRFDSRLKQLRQKLKSGK